MFSLPLLDDGLTMLEPGIWACCLVLLNLLCVGANGKGKLVLVVDSLVCWSGSTMALVPILPSELSKVEKILHSIYR